METRDDLVLLEGQMTTGQLCDTIDAIFCASETAVTISSKLLNMTPEQFKAEVDGDYRECVFCYIAGDDDGPNEVREASPEKAIMSALLAGMCVGVEAALLVKFPELEPIFSGDDPKSLAVMRETLSKCDEQRAGAHMFVVNNPLFPNAGMVVAAGVDGYIQSWMTAPAVVSTEEDKAPVTHDTH